MHEAFRESGGGVEVGDAPARSRRGRSRRCWAPSSSGASSWQVRTRMPQNSAPRPCRGSDARESRPPAPSTGSVRPALGRPGNAPPLPAHRACRLGACARRRRSAAQASPRRHQPSRQSAARGGFTASPRLDRLARRSSRSHWVAAIRWPWLRRRAEPPARRAVRRFSLSSPRPISVAVTLPSLGTSG